MVNTHLGLYPYSCLPFGVASAPAIFQWMMDQLLNSLTGVRYYYLDDIMGKITKEHLNNLSHVLKRLQDKGFRLKKVECHLLQSLVESMSSKQMAYTPPLPNNKPLQKLEHNQHIRIALLSWPSKLLWPFPSQCLHGAPPTELLAVERSCLGVVQKCVEAFQAMKGMLSSDQVLAHMTLLYL